MSRYVWCEDAKSGYQFWKCLFGTAYPDIIVETQNSNSKLNRAADNINDENLYYIILDTAIDNPDVLRELTRLKRNISRKNNIKTISIHSFEYSLLSFEFLEQWIFAENDDLKEKRSEIIKAKDQFVKLIKSGGNSDELIEFKSVYGFPKKYNSEKISAKLLNMITRNTGFETDKSKVGPCFITECCEWENRQADDICGLDNKRLSISEKMDQIIEHSVLQAAFKEAGL